MGFAPDLSNPDLRYDAWSAKTSIWFRPAPDPYCRGNTRGRNDRAHQAERYGSNP